MPGALADPLPNWVLPGYSSRETAASRDGKDRQIARGRDAGERDVRLCPTHELTVTAAPIVFAFSVSADELGAPLQQSRLMNHTGRRPSINDHDHLVYGGSDVVELARRYGTPLHVVDESAVRRNYRAFLGAFRLAYREVSVFYSYKTNCVPGVLGILHEEGCGAEVVSPYELWIATRLRVPPSRIIYNGVNKSVDDLRGAIQHGVGLINVDSAGALHRLSDAAKALNRRVNVGLRIDPAVGWVAHFGLSPDVDRIAALVETAGENRLLNIRGLH